MRERKLNEIWGFIVKRGRIGDTPNAFLWRIGEYLIGN